MLVKFAALTIGVFLELVFWSHRGSNKCTIMDTIYAHDRHLKAITRGPRTVFGHQARTSHSSTYAEPSHQERGGTHAFAFGYVGWFVGA